MVSRIEIGYRERLRCLLGELGIAQPEREAEALLSGARRRAAEEGVPVEEALARAYEGLRARVRRLLAVESPTGAPRLLCDESLGGLARWLRAAGCDTLSVRGVKGDALLRAALAEARSLLTTDGHLLERRLVHEGRVRVVWVPSRMPVLRQLTLVMGDLALTPLTPRCMSCGAELAPVEKQEVRERIPPKTALWKDDYFLCRGCGKLLWQGTHWSRIEKGLAEASRGLEGPRANNE
ncbi:MAG TPA: Mut7-C RNAse domain-containing protein [Vicinamibacteria bacterium]|nr:Mut7-C RNAse domain-containing protein [Vicinamibacteria bacterium]